MILNEYEIERNLDRFRSHPVLGPPAEVLANLMWWTNANSDGWPYWSPPSRASKDLQELFRLLGHPEADEDSVTVAEVRGAYVPIKRFLSKRGVDPAVVFGPAR